MRFTGFLFSMLLCVCSLSANNRHNDLLPNLRFNIAPTDVGDWGAISMLGEAGQRDLRANSTYGFYLTPCQRIKVTGEMLMQDLQFKVKDRREWLSQYAVGGEYQMLFPDCWFQRIDLGGSFSHSYHHHLRSRHHGGKQRFAGSNCNYGFAGFTLELWCGAQLSLKGNYDHLRFERRYEADKTVKGWGGSAQFTQQFLEHHALTLTGEIRRAYNFYEAVLTCNNFLCDRGLECGIFGNYTEGKKGVPDVGTCGVQISFRWDVCERRCDAYNPMYSSRWIGCFTTPCDSASWMAAPAVYIPVVQTIKDKRQ